jgi:hypothetical protein
MRLNEVLTKTGRSSIGRAIEPDTAALHAAGVNSVSVRETREEKRKEKKEKKREEEKRRERNEMKREKKPFLIFLLPRATFGFWLGTV